jgi:hypothetical protein
MDVTAWETISKGGLLLGFDSKRITSLLDIYSAVYRVNELSSLLIEAVTGVQSALVGADQSKHAIVGSLQAALSELQSAFNELDEK